MDRGHQQGDAGEVGGVIHFRFAAPERRLRHAVRDLRPGERVRWEVVDGPEEWIGTEVVFDLSQEDDFTIVMFKHDGWREPVEFMNHCSTKWATFLMSLKQLVETGYGSAGSARRPDQQLALRGRGHRFVCGLLPLLTLSTADESLTPFSPITDIMSSHAPNDTSAVS